jgi:type I restriction enzyme S subunit
MKRYEKYKNSGVERIGEIPAGWNVKRLKHFAKICNGKDQKEVLIDEGGYPVFGTGGEFGRASTFLYDKPSVLLGRKGTIDKPFYIEEPFWTVDTLFYTQIKESTNPKYFFYLCKTIPFDFYQESSAVPSMTQENLNEILFSSPSLSEQAAIAAYLDHKAAQIDALIEKKELLIEKLKVQRQAIINEAVTKGLNPNVPMKDSGIEWLGEIPEHWQEAKVKHIAQINGRIGFKGYTKEDLVNEGEGALTLGAKHIDKDNNLDLSSPEYISWEKYYESPEIMVKVGDVIITQRGSLGKVCHINKPIGDATINPSMVILNNISIQPRYLYFWLFSNRIQSEVNLLQANTAVPMISQFQLENFPVIFPEKDEQNEIVKYLDETLNKLKNIIDKSLDSIEKLKLYRQSLISEAVTGKIDVRDWKLTKIN